MDVELLTGWIVAVIGAAFFYAILEKFLSTFNPENYKRGLTGIAITNGFFLAVGPTPEVIAAVEISQLTPFLSANYPSIVQTLLNAATMVNLLLGFGYMLEKGGKVGAFAFWLAFIGGYLLALTWPVGVLVLIIAVGFEEVSKTDRF